MKSQRGPLWRNSRNGDVRLEINTSEENRKLVQAALDLINQDTDKM